MFRNVVSADHTYAAEDSTQSPSKEAMRRDTCRQRMQIYRLRKK